MLGDEVSMTKITDRPNQAAVAAKVLDLDQRGAVDHDGALLGQLFQAEVAELAVALDPIQIDMRQLQPPGIDPHELEGRAGDRRLRARAVRQAADEGRLAGAERTRQEYDVTPPQPLPDTSSGLP